MALTVKKVAKLLRAGAAGLHLDGAPNGVRGLYLHVEHKGNAHWTQRYQLDKRPHWMGLGSALPGDGLTLDQARAAAREARDKLRAGIDPLQQRRAAQAARALAAVKQLSFAEAAAAVIAAKEAGWKTERHRQQWVQTLRQHAFPKIGHLPIQAIDTGLVLRVIEPLWRTRTATATRLRGRIEAILDWAKARNLRTGDNPAAWRGHLQHLLPKHSAVAKVEHFPALPYVDIPAFIAKLQTRKGVAAQALLFIVLTAARSNEALGAHWSEIDLDAKTWTVPAARMKSGREHRVPLSDAAIGLLRELYREGDGDGFLFIGYRAGQPLDRKALTQLLKRMDYGVTVHGFRSSFRTWAAEQTNFAREVAEQALAHAIPDATERAYKRTTLFDKRRQLMAAWARYCTSPAAPKHERGGNVVGIGGR
jgi:integrase